MTRISISTTKMFWVELFYVTRSRLSIVTFELDSRQDYNTEKDIGKKEIEG